LIIDTRVKALDMSKKVHLMGVVNVTPDSFSDGGKYNVAGSALRRIEELVDEGADIIDIGGESTRPGSVPVGLNEELSRVIPVIKEAVKILPDVVLSVDTTKSDIAKAAIEEGACIVNDISALGFDEDMIKVVSYYKVPVILMHMKGAPRTMQANPQYKDVVSDVKEFLKKRALSAERGGVDRKNILIDPGIGFGKTVKHNLELLRSLDKFGDLGYPVVIGTSRKSFIGKVLGGERVREDILPVYERQEGTLVSCLWSFVRGANILRVHDVRPVKRILRLWKAIESADSLSEQDLCRFGIN